MYEAVAVFVLLQQHARALAVLQEFDLLDVTVGDCSVDVEAVVDLPQTGPVRVQVDQILEQLVRLLLHRDVEDRLAQIVSVRQLCLPLLDEKFHRAHHSRFRGQHQGRVSVIVRFISAGPVPYPGSLPLLPCIRA